MARIFMRCLLLTSIISLCILLGTLVNPSVYFWSTSFNHYFADRSQSSLVADQGMKEFFQGQVDATGHDKTKLLQDSSLSQARQRFLRWDKVNPEVTSAIGEDVDSRISKGYLIYRCDNTMKKTCGGLGDRVKAMMMGYVIANLTGRVFKSEILSSSCPLHHHLEPNLINWTLATSFHPDLDELTPNTKIINKANNREFYENIDTTSFSELVGDAQFVYLRANLDYSRGLQQSEIYSRQLAWMRLTSPHQVQATIYRRLFKLAPNLQKRLQELLAKELPSPEHKLVCAHLRMGRNPTIPHDFRVTMEKEELSAVWKFISNQSKSDFYRVFIMADSEEAMELAQLQSFGHRQIKSPGAIKHIDHVEHLSYDEICSAQEKLIFDLHLLMNCDVLLVSNSGLSRLAAYLRGLDEALYCLVKVGRIMPCSMDNLKGIYHVMG